MIEFATAFPPDDELKKEFSENVLLEVQFQESTSLDVDMGQVIEVPTSPPYKGEYEVIPKFTEEVLKTKNKFMKDNVVVYPIEVARVSNPSGGTTVYIGGMTNG